MRQLYRMLPCASLEQGEFISTQWLTNWLNNDEQLGPVDNEHLLSSHGKLNPDKFRDFRLISKEAVRKFLIFIIIIFSCFDSDIFTILGSRVVCRIQRKAQTWFRQFVLGLRSITMQHDST